MTWRKCGERAGAGGGAGGDLEPAAVAVEGAGAEVEIDGEEAVGERYVGGGLGEADLGAAGERVVEGEGEVGGGVDWEAGFLEAALVSEGGVGGGGFVDGAVSLVVGLV